jgi:hypothetical protein
LADESRDLPALSGLVLYEVPAGPQFVVGEFGPVDDLIPTYDEGSCTWEAEKGIVCALDYSVVGWTEALELDGIAGAAFIDLDGNGAYDSASESVLWGIRARVNDAVRAVFSPSLAQALLDQDPNLDLVLPAEESTTFWKRRDAGRQATAAVAAWPDLHAIVIGTETDHRQPLPDHPHISGLAWALYSSGAAWVRVNPDDAYTETFTGTSGTWADNDANSVESVGDSEQRLEPDSIEASGRGLVTAAAMEIADRAYASDWSLNLAETLPK